MRKTVTSGRGLARYDFGHGHSPPRAAHGHRCVAEVWQAAWHDGHRGHVPDALIDARDPAYFAARSRDLVDHVTVAVDGDDLLGVLIVKADELQQI